MKKRFLALLMAFCMVLSLCSVTAFAEGENVAQVGETSYTSISDAISAAKDGGEVKLLANVSDVTIPIGTTVTIDLNGLTISSSSNHAITNNGVLTVTDSSSGKTGKVDGGTTSGKGALYNAPGATATLNGGTFTGSKWYVIKNLGTMTINGATITQNDASSSGIDNGYYNDATNDCGVTYPTSATVTLTIESGNFSGGMNTVKNDDFGVLTIKGGTFTNTSGPLVLNWNTATISGGEFTSTANGKAVLANGYCGDADVGEMTITGGKFTAYNGGEGSLLTSPIGSTENKGTLTVEGGDFKGTWPETANSIPYTVSVSGGTFSSETVEDYTNGATVVKNNDGTYSLGIDEENAVASVKGIGYTTLSDAIAAAGTNGVVTLLKNVNLTTTQNISASVTIDMDGKTITGPENDWAFSCTTNSDVVVEDGTIEGYKGFNFTDGTLTLTDVSLTTTERCIGNYDNSTVTVGAGSTVESTGHVAIIVWGNGTSGTEGCKTPTLNVYGTVKTTNYQAISTNGTDYSQPDINIYDGASVTSSNSAGMYIPNVGTVNISGGTITGYASAIAIKCGTLNISGGTLTATGPDATPTEGYSNGIYDSGAAIQIESNDDYKVSATESGTVTVNITGGEIISENGYAIYEYVGVKDDEDLADDTHLSSMTISGEDTAISGEKGALLISEELGNKETDPIAISGGKFSSSVAEHVVATLTAELVSRSDTDTPYSYYTSVEEAQKAASKYDTINDLSSTVDESTETCTIVLDYDDGVSANVIYTVSTSGGSIELPTPTRSGYTFRGWTDGTSIYAGGETYTVPTDTKAGKSITLTAKWTYNGGGGTATYSITVPSVSNGSVTASPTNASKGTTVTLTVSPNEGYELSALTVTDADGNVLTLTDKGSGKYTFTMPASKVTVAAAFKAAAHDCPSKNFTDVDVTQYYHEAVDWAVLNGVTVGTSATTFSPNASCTRAQMVTFLWRAAGSPTPGSTTNPFTDVNSSAYYYDAVLWAVEKGITVGTSESTFSPDATVTRGQTVTFLYRYAGSPAVSGGNNFTDVSADAYYADAVQWAVANEVTYGTSTTTFSPENDCTRAQIVTFLYRDLVG